MSIIPWVYPVKRHEVIDGDSVRVWLDCGWNQTFNKICRISGCDTPERYTASGRAVTQVVRLWCQRSDNQMYARSTDQGKYQGRFVGDVFFVDNQGDLDGDTLGGFLQKHGLCKTYEGGLRTWTQGELLEIEERANKLAESWGLD